MTSSLPVGPIRFLPGFNTTVALVMFVLYRHQDEPAGAGKAPMAKNGQRK